MQLTSGAEERSGEMRKADKSVPAAHKTCYKEEVSTGSGSVTMATTVLHRKIGDRTQDRT